MIPASLGLAARRSRARGSTRSRRCRPRPRRARSRRRARAARTARARGRPSARSASMMRIPPTRPPRWAPQEMPGMMNEMTRLIAISAAPDPRGGRSPATRGSSSRRGSRRSRPTRRDRRVRRLRGALRQSRRGPRRSRARGSAPSRGTARRRSDHPERVHVEADVEEIACRNIAVTSRHQSPCATYGPKSTMRLSSHEPGLLMHRATGVVEAAALAGCDEVDRDVDRDQRLRDRRTAGGERDARARGAPAAA